MKTKEFSISKKAILGHVTGKPAKYCLDCKTFFVPALLEAEPHASHYTWFLPVRKKDFDQWIDRIRTKDEQVWGVILDEDGVESRTYCPSEFTLEITE